MARLTIGMPVYNGEAFIEEAIESLLGQTFDDFTLIIADNASTDATEDICRSYAVRDPRVSYLRHDKNLGAAENHNVLVRLAETEYFKWAASDDVHAPTMVSACIDALENHPEMIGAFTGTLQIDEHGSPIKTEASRLRSESPRPYVRFRHIIAVPNSCFPIFGVYRTGTMKSTNLMTGLVGSDRTLLAELSLIGRWIEIPEALVGRRMHPDAYSQTQASKASSAATHWTGSTDKRVSLRATYHDLVNASPALTPSERRLCHLEIETSYRVGRLVDFALKRTTGLRSRLPTSRRPTNTDWTRVRSR